MSRSAVTDEIIAGSLSGVICTTIGHPLDCIKVYQQTAAATTTTTRVVSSTALHAARTMWRTIGFSAFTRGIVPPLLSSALMNSIMFVSFAEVKRILEQSPLLGKGGGGDNSSSISSTALFMAGAISGIMTAYVSTPFDWIKVQTQTRGRATTSSSLTSWNTLTRRPSLLFTGHVANLGREGIFTCIYLGLYHNVRQWLLLTTNHTGETETGPPPLPFIVLASSLSGGLAWLACYPCDTIKSIQQAAGEHSPRRTLQGAWRSVQQQKGTSILGSLYRGAGASVVRACLVTSCRLIVYEYAMHFLKQQQQQ